MCMICVEFQKQRMTTDEARRALGEMIGDLESDHVREVERMIAEAENPPESRDDESEDVESGNC